MFFFFLNNSCRVLCNVCAVLAFELEPFWPCERTAHLVTVYVQNRSGVVFRWMDVHSYGTSFKGPLN